MIYFKFFLWFLLSEAIILLVRFLLRKTKPKLGLDIIFIVVELVVAIGLAFITMAGPKAFRPLQPFMFAMYVAMMMDALAKIVYLIVNIFRKKEKNRTTLSIISCILGVIFLAFGMINMQIVSPKYLTFASNKLINEYKVAFISDMHIGSVQPASTSIKTINKIKEENPDFTFLGGDIVDGYTKIEDMEKVLSAFKDFTTPVYFVYGNHDLENSFANNKFEDCLIRNNIIILKDEFVILGDDLTVLGREDVSIMDRKDVESLMNPNNGSYLVVVDHQTETFKDNCKLGIDLQLSGHTHAGQLFPLRMIYSFAVHAYGIYYNGDAVMNVSAGGSGWRVPLRTEIGCQFEIVTLKPNN